MTLKFSALNSCRFAFRREKEKEDKGHITARDDNDIRTVLNKGQGTATGE